MRPGPNEPPPRLVQLTTDLGLSFCPTVSRDGTLMAYASDRGGSNLDLWIKQLPDGEPRRITNHPSDDYEPHFSPDGTNITFRSNRDGGGVYVIPSLGGGEPVLLAANGRRPRFSPDGKLVAYWTGSNWRAKGGYLPGPEQR